MDDDQAPAILQEEDEDTIDLEQIPEIGSTSNKRAREEESIFVQSDDEEEDASEVQQPPSKRKRVRDEAADDKKKLRLKTAYEGFSIYGRILCLIVKRRGGKKPATEGPISGSQMLENWVSTQAQNEGMLDDDD